MSFMGYQRQENGDSPEDEVVGIGEHELGYVKGYVPIRGEVVCLHVVVRNKMNDKNRTRSFVVLDKEQKR